MNTKKYTALILSACGLLTLSVFVLSSDSSPEVQNQFLVLESKDFATYITAQEAVILDVRTPAEFAAGHLSGAINIDSAAPDFQQQLNALDKGKAYAIYCRSGNRSATALRIMRSQNFVSVVDLGGGIIAWERNQLPTCTNSLTC